MYLLMWNYKNFVMFKKHELFFHYKSEFTGTINMKHRIQNFLYL